jgi:uncharacterized protein with PIN domain
MAIDAEFTQTVLQTLESEGWLSQVQNFSQNPLAFSMKRLETTISVLMYARRLTAQESLVSDHNRPVGEMHMQMTFDNVKRGGRGNLIFASENTTVLFGFTRQDQTYIIVAFDPRKHETFAFSSSLQVKKEVLDQAFQYGIAFHTRKNGETVVAFRQNMLSSYLENPDAYHGITPSTGEEAAKTEEYAKVTKDTEDVLTQRGITGNPPHLEAGDRQIVMREISQFVRSRQFAQGIRMVYERCAICGFQYDEVLDAAHIIPVAEGGEDTYENGLGLCPNCHRMFDKGLILVDEMYQIYLHPQHAETYDQIGKADSLNDLRTQLRTTLWLPNNPSQRPNPSNLRAAFSARKPKN